MYAGGEKACRSDRSAQQLPNRLARDRCGKRNRKTGELGRSSIRSKQATETLSRFDLGIEVGRLFERYDQFVV